MKAQGNQNNDESDDMTDECFEEFKKWVTSVYKGPIRAATTTQRFDGMELDNLESDSLWRGWKSAWKFKENATNNKDAAE